MSDASSSDTSLDDSTIQINEDRPVQVPLPVDTIMRESGENDFSSSPLLNSRDDVGIQLLCNAADAQGLNVHYHRRLIFEVFDEKRRVIFRQNSPANSAVYTYCARQKHIAKLMMAAEGVPVPSGSCFRDYEAALRFFQQSGVVVTVKPVDGSSGYGVTSGISTEEEFARAWEFAREESRDVVVEQNITGQDIRIVVIGGKAEAAYVREPANVIGDGEHTIRQLVDKKNALRRSNPALRLDMIKRFELLERKGISLDYVPADGEKLQLTTVANASAGGETVQIFDYLDRELLDIAERAARCFPGLVQVGVDLIYVAPEHWKPGSPRGYVIEVNSNPGICDTVFPSFGRAIDAPGKLVSHVFSEQGAQFLSTHPSVSISLATAYRYADFARVFGSGEQRQIALIKQAAHALNLKVEDLSENVFRLIGEQGSCLFHSGMSEGVRMVTRKITRNREWMDTVLPVNTLFPLKDEQRLNRFRLLVVDGKLISALLVRPGKRGQETMRTEVGDLVHPSVLPVIDQTLDAIFDPPVVGIDLLVGDISSNLDIQPWKVIDAVCNPNLAWHHFPDVGVGRDVAKAIVGSSLPTLDPALTPAVCERFVVRGKVQGVGFRRWFKLLSVLHDVRGWVRNLQEGGSESALEVVLEGSPVSINTLYTLCQRGPKSAQVESVAREPQPFTGKLQFSVIG